jgi:hypothetical protein
MMVTRTRFALALVAAALAAGIAAPARAMGYDSLSCKELSDRKNEYLGRNGYCFPDEALQKAYGKADCKYKSPDEVVFSENDRMQMSLIVRTERRKDCPA